MNYREIGKAIDKFKFTPPEVHSLLIKVVHKCLEKGLMDPEDVDAQVEDCIRMYKCYYKPREEEYHAKKNGGKVTETGQKEGIDG